MGGTTTNPQSYSTSVVTGVSAKGSNKLAVSSVKLTATAATFNFLGGISGTKDTKNVLTTSVNTGSTSSTVGGGGGGTVYAMRV